MAENEKEGLSRSLEHKKNEENRVSKILEGDAKDRSDEQRRRNARQRLANGDDSAAQDSVLSPTPEQLSKGDFANYALDGRTGSARSIKTVRRVLCSHVQRAHRRGVLDDDEYKACVWYRNQYDRAGLEGQVPSVDFLREVFSSPQSRLPFAEANLIAQDNLRAARQIMTQDFLYFFDLVVINEVPISLAEKQAKCPYRAGGETLKLLAGQLAGFTKKEKHG